MSPPRLLARRLFAVSVVCVAACGGDDGGNPAVDAGTDPDAASTDAANPDAADPDAASPDAMTDATVDAGVDGTPDATPDAMTLTGDTCQAAETITITGGTGIATVSGTTDGYDNDYEPPEKCTGFLEDGPDRIYQIALPAGSRLTAIVTPVAGYDAGLYVVGTPATLCDANPIVCLAGEDQGDSGEMDTLVHDNAGAATTVFVVVDGTSVDGDAYSLSVTVAPIPVSTGEACGDADVITLTGGHGSASGSTRAIDNYANDYEPTNTASCAPGEGNDHVYRVTVPANEQLRVLVTPTSTDFDPSLYLVEGPAAACDATPLVCLAGTDIGTAEYEEAVTYANPSASPVDVFIVVDSLRVDVEGTFDLDVYTGALPGDTCQNRETVTLTSGAATVHASTNVVLGYANDYEPPTACTGYDEIGPDRVHVVSVPAGQTLTATATPRTLFDLGLYFVEGAASACDASPIVCLAGIDENNAGEAETVTHTNSTGSAQTVMVVVDSFDLDDWGPYSLELQVQ